jgi:D-alanine-D-alanine ligase
MSDKKNVLILMGGRSAEHEVSLQSARNVIQALDREQFEPVIVGISHSGSWYHYEGEDFLINPDDPEKVALNSAKGEEAALVCLEGKGACIIGVAGSNLLKPVDVAFPVIHGTYGEDGTIQGLFKIVNLPFVGAGVLGSSVGMDKAVMKQLLSEAGVPNAPGFELHVSERGSVGFDEVVQKYGSKVFVKPANLGSSVGISSASSEQEYKEALDLAFTFDFRVVVESAIVGREIECAVLGNEDPKPSELGEIIPEGKHGFYSYDAKYVDPDGAKLIAPAELSEEQRSELQALAVRGYKALRCEGMGRVDMFLTPEGKVYINEINTIPGFTKISMYPRLWGLTGVTYTALITRLLELAFQRYERESGLSTEYF